MNSETPTRDSSQPGRVLAPSATPVVTPLAPSPKPSAPVETESAIATVDLSKSDLPVVPPSLLPGAEFAGYQLLEMIGRGGMGIVYRAKQPGTNQIVALKRMRDGVLADHESIERFRKEIEALGRLQSSANITPVYHAAEFEGQFFYVMPFYSGKSVAANRERFKSDRIKAVRMLEKIARAVHQLHLHQLLHRDIKPSNILLDGDEEPFLSDFGLAKFLDAEQSLSHTDQRLGTPQYMAPEQTGLVKGAKVGLQADVWSLGVVLYELVAGKRPFVTEDEKDTAGLLYKIIHEKPARPSKLRPDVDVSLESIILKCLEKDPQERFATAEQLADELGRWLRKEKVETQPTSFTTPLRRAVRRRPWAAAALSCTFVVFALAAVAAIDARRRDTPEFHLNALRQELIQKGEINLVTPKARPRWHALAIANNVDTDGWYEEFWRIQTWELGLVELLRDVPFEAYRVRAEIGHIKSNSRSGVYDGHVGIFVGHQAKNDDPATPHFCCNFIFNDLVDDHSITGKMNTAMLKYRVYAKTVVGSPADIIHGWSRAAKFEHTTPDAPRWTVLEMEVRPDRIQCRFNGEIMEPLERAMADTGMVERIAEAQKQNPARYGPLGDWSGLKLSSSGSLGLVVSQGSIAVKSFTVTRVQHN